MLKIAICDYISNEIEALNAMIESSAELNDIQIDVDIYTRGIDLLNDLANGKEIDLLFIEVDLGEEDGKEIVRHFQIMMKIKNIKVVFMSRSLNNIMSLFELKPYHFITKPLNALTIEELIVEIHNKYASEMSYSHYRMGKVVSKTDVKTMIETKGMQL